jgi:hypothetical protein
MSGIAHPINAVAPSTCKANARDVGGRVRRIAGVCLEMCYFCSCVDKRGGRIRDVLRICRLPAPHRRRARSGDVLRNWPQHIEYFRQHVGCTHGVR